jgi:hypothetical protein
MRKDMFKVIVERERGNGNAPSGEKSRSAYGRSQRSKWKSEDEFEKIDKPSNESMKRSLGYNKKSLNENLNPLRRFMQKRIGRPWNKVWSEICAEINSDSTVQKHVLDHVDDFVVKNVYLKDKKPFVVDPYGYHHNGEIPVNSDNFRSVGYVHPTTGIFTKIPKAPKKLKKETPVDFVKISEDQQMHKIGANWFIVEVVAYDKKYDSDIRHIKDVLLGKYIRDFYTYATVYYNSITNTKTTDKHTSEASIWRKKYHGDYYGISKKSANTKEIKKYVG